MRILLVNHTFPPESCAGSELCVLSLAQELQARGHRAAVFYRFSDSQRDEYEIVSGDFQGIPTYKINHTYRDTRTFQDIYLNPLIAAKFSYFLHEWQPDLVHFHHLTNLSLSLVQEAKTYGAGVVVTLHDYWLLCQRGQLLKSDLQLCNGPSDSACRSCLSVQLLRGPAQRWVSVLRRLQNRREGSGHHLIDLLDLAAAKISTPCREFVALNTFGLGESPQSVLQMHPPAEVRYELHLPQKGVLQTAIAMHPSTYNQPGQGVRFEILRGEEILAQRELNPKADTSHRGWHFVAVELAPSIADTDSLTFRTSALADEDNQFCTAGFRQPSIHLPDTPSSSGQTGMPLSQGSIRRLVKRGAKMAADVYTALSPMAREGIEHRRHWVERVKNDADLFISPSRFLRDFFLRHGWPEERILFSDNGFLIPEPIKKREPTLPIVFGYIGTWIPSKGVDLLLKAFREISPDKARLRVYGFFPGFDGWEDYETHLRSLAGPAVEFCGRYDPKDVYSLLREIDCLIMPSIWWENSPMSLHESFLAQVPVITADVGGMAEQVASGGGLTFRHRNTESLREVIQTVIRQPQILNDLRAGIPRVKSVQEHADEVLQWYHKVLEERPRAATV